MRRRAVLRAVPARGACGRARRRLPARELAAEAVEAVSQPGLPVSGQMQRGVRTLVSQSQRGAC